MNLRAAFRDAPIKRKLMLFGMLSMSFALLVISLIMVVMSWADWRDRTISEMHIHARLIGANAAAALLAGDQGAATQMLAALAATPDIVDAVIYDREGKAFARFIVPAHSASAPMPMPEHGSAYLFNSEQLVVAEPIRFQGEELGTIQLEADLRELHAAILHNIGFIFIIALGVFLASMVLFARLQKTIVVPLLKLADGMREVADRQNYAMRVAVYGQDEVGTLAGAFNAMLERIQQRDAELVQHREHLEEQIELRTASLIEAQRIARLGSWEWDITNDRLDWSDELYHIFGLAPRQVRATHEAILQVVHPQDLPQVDARIRAALAQKRPCSLDYRILLPDGSERHVHEQAEVFRNKDGHPVMMRGTVQDITGRKQIEAALQASMQKYQLLFENSRDALMTLAPPSWKFTSANPATLQMFGASSVAEFTARGPWQVSPERQPDGRPSGDKAQEMIATALREGAHFFEWEHCRLNGQPFAADVLLTRMNIGEEVFLQATVRDISERKRAAEELAQSERHFRAVAESANDAIITSTGAGIITGWNPAAERLFGHAAAEIVGQSLAVLMPERFRTLHQEGLARVTAGGVPHVIGKTVELAGLRKDGSEFPLEISLSQWQSATGPFYTAIIRDITQRRQAEEKIRQMNDELEERVAARTAELVQATHELEQASRGKDEFLAAISHELKTPLNHILGFSEILKEGLAGELNTEQKGMAQDIHDAGNRQLALVNSLIELARLQAGRMKLRAEPLEPARLLGEIAARHAARASAAGLDFTVEAAQSLGEMPLDREVVTHILDQLLENAFKFTPTGGKVSLAARRVPRTEVAAPVRTETGEYLELAVADNGPGIVPEVLPRLFRPFVQGEGSFSRRYAGTGIGLTLVRLLAELHGGGSGVENRPGAGAKLLVWLPCAAAQSGGEPASPPPGII